MMEGSKDVLTADSGVIRWMGAESGLLPLLSSAFELGRWGGTSGQRAIMGLQRGTLTLLCLAV